MIQSNDKEWVNQKECVNGSSYSAPNGKNKKNHRTQLLDSLE